MNNNQLLVGVVIIGRNEGDRLIRCLKSLVRLLPYVVYVDSASTDGSVIAARSRGLHVVSLDMSQAFTAARARNVGFKKLIELYPHLTFVQFVDGDCIVNAKWIQTAVDFLQSNPAVAVVCGRRKEIFPQRSIYNRMCDHEWDTPIGQAKYCGGDALMRVEVVNLVDGFRNSLVAGEEPELCIRIRRAGYSIWRLDAEMTLHDAAIIKFSQWWKRTMRGGYAFAEGAYLHGAAPEYHWVAESKRAWIWGVIIPGLSVAIFFISWKLSLLILLAYPVQIVKLTLKSNPRGSWQVSFFLVLGKFAELVGQLKFFKKQYLNGEISLIEYK